MNVNVSIKKEWMWINQWRKNEYEWLIQERIDINESIKKEWMWMNQ